jgi:hypothetical protein
MLGVRFQYSTCGLQQSWSWYLANHYVERAVNCEHKFAWLELARVLIGLSVHIYGYF